MPPRVAKVSALALSYVLALSSQLDPSGAASEISRLDHGSFGERVSAARRLKSYRGRRVQASLLRHALDPNESSGVVDECLDSLCAVGDEAAVAALRARAPAGRSDQLDVARIIAMRIEGER